MAPVSTRASWTSEALDEDDGDRERDGHHHQRAGLDARRQRARAAPLGDDGSQRGLAQQPPVEPVGGACIAGRGDQQERRGRQHRQEDPEDTDQERDRAHHDEQGPHQRRGAGRSRWRDRCPAADAKSALLSACMARMLTQPSESCTGDVPLARPSAVGTRGLSPRTVRCRGRCPAAAGPGCPPR